MKDNFEIKDDDQDELMKMVAMHAQNTHGIKDVPPDLMDKIKKAIKK
jgi:predicted small metal-binding protein